VSAQSTWRALDEAGEARTAANRPAFLPQTLAFGAQTFFWPCNLPQERYNSVKPVSKKEIPVNGDYSEKRLIKDKTGRSKGNGKGKGKGKGNSNSNGNGNSKDRTD
jgi:hypothetical protein